MSNLDQSLDEIIGKRPARTTSRPASRGRNAGPRRATKQIGSRPAAGRGNIRPRGGRPPVNAVSRVAKILGSTGFTKVNVEGLPRDIKQDAVRVCHIIIL